MYHRKTKFSMGIYCLPRKAVFKGWFGRICISFKCVSPDGNGIWSPSQIIWARVLHNKLLLWGLLPAYPEIQTSRHACEYSWPSNMPLFSNIARLKRSSLFSSFHFPFSIIALVLSHHNTLPESISTQFFYSTVSGSPGTFSFGYTGWQKERTIRVQNAFCFLNH